MPTKFLPTLILIAAVSLPWLPRNVMAADDGILFINGMDVGVTGLYCAKQDDAGQLVLGPLGAQSSGVIERAVFPPREECKRLYVHMEDGAGWQYTGLSPIPHPKDAMIQRIELARHDESEKTPTLHIRFQPEHGGTLVEPGMWARTLTKQMRIGMQESDWERIAVPGLASPERSGEYAMRLGGSWSLWSLTKNGISYKETASGKRIAVQAEFVFAGNSFYCEDGLVFSLAVHGFFGDFEPWLLVYSDKAVAFTREGKSLLPQAAPLPEAMAGDMVARWEAFTDVLSTAFAVDRPTVPGSENLWEDVLIVFWDCIGEKLAAIPPGSDETLFMIFGNEVLRAELELPLGAKKPILRFIRNDADVPVAMK